MQSSAKQKGKNWRTGGSCLAWPCPEYHGTVDRAWHGVGEAPDNACGHAVDSSGCCTYQQLGQSSLRRYPAPTTSCTAQGTSSCLPAVPDVVLDTLAWRSREIRRRRKRGSRGLRGSSRVCNAVDVVQVDMPSITYRSSTGQNVGHRLDVWARGGCRSRQDARVGSSAMKGPAPCVQINVLTRRRLSRKESRSPAKQRPRPPTSWAQIGPPSSGLPETTTCKHCWSWSTSLCPGCHNWTDMGEPQQQRQGKP